MKKTVLIVISMIGLVVLGFTIGVRVGRCTITTSTNTPLQTREEEVETDTLQEAAAVAQPSDTEEGQSEGLEEQSGASEEGKSEGLEEQAGDTEESQSEGLEEQSGDTQEISSEAPRESLAVEATNAQADGLALHVEDTMLMDENGQPVQLKGISTHGINWYPQYVNRDCFKELREEWGVNVIRLSLYTEGYNGYCNGADKEQLKQIIFDGVEYATKEGLYVIIDWHILSDGNPLTHMDEAGVFFEEVSKKYGDYTNVIYEICNEPNGNVSWKEVKAYAEEIIGIIRKNDQNGIVLVGTPQWSQLVGEAAKDPITNYDNIMYTLHFYADTHRDSLRQELERAVQNGLPVFVSEFSICEASGDGKNNIQEADKWIQLLERYSISYVAWNMANKNESSSIFSADCNKTSGFTPDDLSESGLWLKSTLARQEHERVDYKSRENKSPESKSVEKGVEQEAMTYDKEALRVTTVATDTWESNGNDSCNYSVTIENLSEETTQGWEIELSFNQEIVDVQGWCGEFSFEGNTLYIKNADFNGQIQPRTKTRDIGFIITGPSGICVEEK